MAKVEDGEKEVQMRRDNSRRLREMKAIDEAKRVMEERKMQEALDQRRKKQQRAVSAFLRAPMNEPNRLNPLVHAQVDASPSRKKQHIPKIAADIGAKVPMSHDANRPARPSLQEFIAMYRQKVNPPELNFEAIPTGPAPLVGPADDSQYPQQAPREAQPLARQPVTWTVEPPQAASTDQDPSKEVETTSSNIPVSKHKPPESWNITPPIVRNPVPNQITQPPPQQLEGRHNSYIKSYAVSSARTGNEAASAVLCSRPEEPLAQQPHKPDPVFQPVHAQFQKHEPAFIPVHTHGASSERESLIGELALSRRAYAMGTADAVPRRHVPPQSSNRSEMSETHVRPVINNPLYRRPSEASFHSSTNPSIEPPQSARNPPHPSKLPLPPNPFARIPLQITKHPPFSPSPSEKPMGNAGMMNKGRPPFSSQRNPSASDIISKIPRPKVLRSNSESGVSDRGNRYREIHSKNNNGSEVHILSRPSTPELIGRLHRAEGKLKDSTQLFVTLEQLAERSHIPVQRLAKELIGQGQDYRTVLSLEEEKIADSIGRLNSKLRELRDRRQDYGTDIPDDSSSVVPSSPRTVQSEPSRDPYGLPFPAKRPKHLQSMRERGMVKAGPSYVASGRITPTPPSPVYRPPQPDRAPTPKRQAPIPEETERDFNDSAKPNAGGTIQVSPLAHLLMSTLSPPTLPSS